MHIMDGQRVTNSQNIRRRHSDAFKQSLVDGSLVAGASVAAIAQDAVINANLLFNWRRLHLQGLAPEAGKESRAAMLLPVTVVELPSVPTTAAALPPPSPALSSSGSIEINVRGTVVRVRGPVDEASQCTVLRALASVS